SYVENNPLNKTDPTGESDVGTTCHGSGSNQVCETTGTITPTGSHIPHQVTATQNMSTGKVNFSGSLATPGGHGVALSTDFHTTMSVSGQGTVAKNSAGGDTNRVSKHNYNGKAPSSAGGDSSKADSEFGKAMIYG